MPSVVITQMIYAAVFIAVLLGVEGLYLVMRGSSRSQKAAERRMREEVSQPFQQPRINLRRDTTIEYGPVSALVVALFPPIGPYMAQIQEGRFSPAIALASALVLAVMISAGLSVALEFPMVMELGAGMAIGLGLPMAVVGSTIGSQKKKLAEQLPIAIDLVARGLEAGHPVSVALALVGRELDAPVGPAFRHALAEVNFGLDRKIALENLANKYPDTNLRFFVAALEMHRETGGDLAGVLRNLSRVIRKRENLRKKALALSAEGRATAILVGGLPFVLIAAILYLQPDYYTRVMDDSAFWPSMALAFALWAAGIFTIWRMTDIKV